MTKFIIWGLVGLFAAIVGGFLGAGGGLFGVMFGSAFALGLAVTGMISLAALRQPEGDSEVDMDDDPTDEDKPVTF
jgi:hypothetical protein